MLDSGITVDSLSNNRITRAIEDIFYNPGEKLKKASVLLFAFLSFNTFVIGIILTIYYISKCNQYNIIDLLAPLICIASTVVSLIFSAVGCLILYMLGHYICTFDSINYNLGVISVKNTSGSNETDATDTSHNSSSIEGRNNQNERSDNGLYFNDPF